MIFQSVISLLRLRIGLLPRRIPMILVISGLSIYLFIIYVNLFCNQYIEYIEGDLPVGYCGKATNKKYVRVKHFIQGEWDLNLSLFAIQV